MMVSTSRLSGVNGAILLLALLAVLAAVAAVRHPVYAAPAARSRSEAAAALGADSRANRPAIAVRRRSAAASAASYTIDDVGMPSASYASSAPIGFNDAGQMYGTATRVAKSIPSIFYFDESCIVWTGTRFVDLAPSLTISPCTPYAIGAASPAGDAFTVVGTFEGLYSGGAFSATVGAGTVDFLTFYDHSPSALYAVNGNRQAIGTSWISFKYQPQLLFAFAPGQEFALVQPACLTSTAGCLVTIQPTSVNHVAGEPNPQCPFGGCTLNDAGVALAIDPSTNHYAVRTLGSSAPTTELALSTGSAYTVAINDAGKIVYFTQAQDEVNTVVAAVYDIATGKSTIVPPVSGANCAHYFPIAMNNSGTVLGFTSHCATRDFYWIWDATHGTRDLTASIPVNAYDLKPLAINDGGQILVSLETAGGIVHWGTLNPTTASTKVKPAWKKVRHAF